MTSWWYSFFCCLKPDRQPLLSRMRIPSLFLMANRNKAKLIDHYVHNVKYWGITHTNVTNWATSYLDSSHFSASHSRSYLDSSHLILDSWATSHISSSISIFDSHRPLAFLFSFFLSLYLINLKCLIILLVVLHLLLFFSINYSIGLTDRTMTAEYISKKKQTEKLVLKHKIQTKKDQS